MQNQYYWDLEDPVMSIISHHGILGQKWGIRRYQDKSGRLTAEGKKHKFEDRSKSDTSDRDTVVSNLKTYAVAGGAGIAASIAAVAALPITEGMSAMALPAASWLGLKGLGHTIVDGTKLVAGDIKASNANKKENKFQEEREKNPIDKKTGFHKKTTEMSADEDMERVNPAFKNWDKNTKNNCTLCTMTYELRRRGYDVQARKATQGYAANTLVKDWYKNSKPKIAEGSIQDQDILDAMAKGKAPTIKKEAQDRMIKNTIDDVKSQKDGARGQLAVVWNHTMSGHSIAYAVENGEMTIYDTQSNEKFVGDKACEKYLRKTSQVYVTRLDNCQINTKYIKEVAE